MRARAGVHATVALLALLPLAGCYTYMATSLDSLSPGLQTRVRLDADGFGRVVNQAAMNGVPVQSMDLEGRGVIGRVVSLDPNRLMVELRGAGGSVFAADVPTRSIQEVALRSLSRRRTVGAVAAGVVLFAAVYSGTTGGTTGPDEDPGPDLMVFRLFSILTP